MPILKRTRDKIVANGGEYETRIHKYEMGTHNASGTTYIAKRNKLTKRSILFYFDSLRRVEETSLKGLVALV